MYVPSVIAAQHFPCFQEKSNVYGQVMPCHNTFILEIELMNLFSLNEGSVCLAKQHNKLCIERENEYPHTRKHTYNLKG